MKSLFVSLLAVLPAVGAMEYVVFQRRGRRRAKRTKIIYDHSKTNRADDVHDSTVHHRYYGRSAYP